MRLIDVDALKASCEMADDCKSCPRKWRECNSERMSRMDFCEYLDNAPTYDAPQWVPIEEEVPGNTEMVLTYAMDTEDILFGTVEKCGKGYACVSGDYVLVNISHWMAVPPPGDKNGGVK